jgi:hypothetical protein
MGEGAVGRRPRPAGGGGGVGGLLRSAAAAARGPADDGGDRQPWDENDDLLDLLDVRINRP